MFSFLSSLYKSAQAAITEYRRLAGLSNKNLYLTILKAGKSKIKVPANSAPGESSLPSTHRELTRQSESERERERDRERDLISFPLLITPSLMTSSKPNKLPKGKYHLIGG